MNYYNVLGVGEGATHSEIKKAYRKLSYEKHPDRNSGKDDEYKKINEAYEVLKDANNRHNYDSYTNLGGGGSKCVNANVIDDQLNSLFSDMLTGVLDKGMKKGKGAQIDQFAALFGMPGPDDNVQFDPSIFMNPPHYNVLQEPDDILIEQIISYEQAYQGCCIPVNIEREISKGHTRRIECETVYIDIKKGVDNNEIIKLEKRGNVKDSVVGDVKIKILLERDTNFSREGIDLILYKSVTFKESICGFKFEIKHLNGESINFSSSRGNVVQNGERKVIKSLGFTRDDVIGNLVLVFNVKQPKTLTDEQLKTIENVFSD